MSMSTIMNESASASAAPQATAPSVNPRQALLLRLFHLLPTLATFALLAAVGWLGHQTGWKLPSVSALTRSATTTKANWCAEHNVPEDQCVECQKNLMPKNDKPRWCKEHGVSECPTCQSELAQVSGDVKLPQYDTVAAIAASARPENNSRCKKFTRRIQFESLAAFDKMAIDVDVVSERPMVETLRINGELGYDQSQLAHLSTRVPGTVWKVFKTLGNEVQAGDVLALVDAAEVGKAKSELARALVHLQLKRKTMDSLRSAAGALPERTVRETEAAFEEARIQSVLAQQALVNLGFVMPKGLEKLDPDQLTQRLQGLGLPNELSETLSARGSMTMNLIPITAPQDGVIMEMDVVVGEVVSSDKMLLTLADLRRMWLTLHVKQEDTKRVHVGQTAKFRPDGSTDDVVGTVSAISPSVDERTRTSSQPTSRIQQL